jgi:hypothetical protein
MTEAASESGKVADAVSSEAPIAAPCIHASMNDDSDNTTALDTSQTSNLAARKEDNDANSLGSCQDSDNLQHLLPWAYYKKKLCQKVLLNS